MFRRSLIAVILITAISIQESMAQSKATNPIVYADVPDLSMIRVGDAYYMSSTTMHLSPGLPIMKSADLVNWKLVNYAYDTLADIDELNLENGRSSYGKGSWASSLRFHKGIFYVTTFSQTTGKTYIYTTDNIEKGPWKVHAFQPSLHDHSLFFDDDGRIYLVYGSGKIKLVELNKDFSGIKEGDSEKVIIENASLPAGSGIGLPAEGSQLFKINGRYYLFNITWPKGGMRTVVVHRADRIAGPYEGRIALQDLGVAQGGLIQVLNGDWFAYLFRDKGAVGRIPYLVPVKWENGWPILGDKGKVPSVLDLPASKGLMPGLVSSDDFTRGEGDASLPLVWQWNHNPDNNLWSLRERKGFLRLKTGRMDTSLLQARNTLTQRTIGPQCSGTISLDVSHMKAGDVAGIALLQAQFGGIGIKADQTGKSITMIRADQEGEVEGERLPLSQRTVYLKATCDFTDQKDIAHFFFSLDGKSWKALGQPLHMNYTIPHFMGYRFALFNYATEETGGFVDIDFFHITDQISK